MRYSDLAIETALTLRLIFKPPLRQAEGFVNSLLALMGLELSSPDHTTLSRSGQNLDLTLRRVRRGEPIHLVVDSTASRSWAKVNGPPRNTTYAANGAGRSFTYVSERA